MSLYIAPIHADDDTQFKRFLAARERRGVRPALWRFCPGRPSALAWLACKRASGQELWIDVSDLEP
jgi:hypothetical protein